MATFIDALSGALAGVGQEVFNATILALAVVMLAWHNIWMARHGRELAAQTKEIGEAVATGSRLGARGRCWNCGTSRRFRDCTVLVRPDDFERCIDVGVVSRRRNLTSAWLRS